jgi:hypothetical protein
MAKRGRPPNPSHSLKAELARRAFGADQRASLEGYVRRMFADIPSAKLAAFVASINEAANWYAAGISPRVDKAGHASKTVTKVLVHECWVALSDARGRASLWGQAEADGGKQSEALALARTVIEIVNRSPYPFDLRRIVASAKGTAIIK